MDSLSTTDSKLNELWQDLAEIDEELSILHKRIAQLSAKRKDVHREINRRLSLINRRLSVINRLPLELISRILTLSTESNRVSVSPDDESYKWCAVLLLGAVCREWREITLATPHLWSTVDIWLGREELWSDVGNEWLQRSGALPLSITFTCSQHGLYLVDFDLIPDLKSHSIRWKSLTFNDVGYDIFYGLLNNLEDTRHIETIWIYCGERSWNKIRPFVGEPICPKTFHWLYLSSEKCTGYFKWDNLTHLVAEGINSDDITDILRQAIKIQHCTVKSSRQGKGHQFVPTVNRSLMHLDITLWGLTDFLPNLNLPSLQILECRYIGSSMNGVDVDVIADFIHRSQAPLRDVIYHLDVNYLTSIAGFWHLRFPNVTHLKLDNTVEGATTMIINIFELLAYDQDEIVHPSLQVIELTTYRMTPTVWSHFINLFPQILAERTHHERLPTNSSDTDLTLFSDSPLRRWPSKACIILDHPSKTFDERDVMELHQYLRLLDIQKSGVELELIGNGGIDLLQFAGKIYGSGKEARQQY